MESLGPHKVSFFTWEATWGKALTLGHLQQRGWSLANICFLCHTYIESIDHILLHCGKARLLWELLVSLFRVCWVMQFTIKEMLLGWHDSFGGRKWKKVWRVASLCLFWTIWKKGNRRSFENVELSIQRLKFLFLSNL